MPLLYFIVILFSLIGFINSFFLLFFKNNKRIFNYLYGILLFILPCLNLYNSGFLDGYNGFIQHFFDNINILTYSLLGPTLYIYTRKVYSKDWISFKTFFHFTPFIFIIFLICINYYFNIETLKHFHLKKSGTELKYIINSNFIEFILILTMAIYYIASIKFSINNNQNLTLFENFWVKTVNVFFFFLIFGALTIEVLRVFDNSTIEYHYFNSVLITAFIFLNTCVTIYQYTFTSSQIGFDFLKKKSTSQEVIKKYNKTGLSESLSEEYQKRIIDFMENEKPYLDPEISLLQLSQQLNISRHHVSQVINQQFEMNFNEFINKYRIAESTRLIEKKNNNLNVSDIAFKSGFNSKSTFYKSFKKYKIYSPSEYKKIFF